MSWKLVLQLLILMAVAALLVEAVGLAWIERLRLGDDDKR